MEVICFLRKKKVSGKIHNFSCMLHRAFFLILSNFGQFIRANVKESSFASRYSRVNWLILIVCFAVNYSLATCQRPVNGPFITKRVTIVKRTSFWRPLSFIRAFPERPCIGLHKPMRSLAFAQRSSGVYPSNHGRLALFPQTSENVEQNVIV